MRKYEETVTPSSQASVSGDTLERVSLLLIFAVTLLLVGGMIIDGNKVALSIVCGITFFSIMAALFVLILSGQLGSMVINHQKEVTIRLRDQIQERIWRVEQAPQLPLREEYIQEEVPLLGLPKPTSFVAAVPKPIATVKAAAAAFVAQLPGKITKRAKQIQLRSPEPEVVDYLMGLGIVTQDAGKHLYWNTTLYPTLRDGMTSIRTGVRRVSLEEGEGREGEGTEEEDL